MGIALAVCGHAQAAAPPSEWAEVWLAVSVNGIAAAAPARLARHPDGRLLASPADLAGWRIRAPDTAALAVGGRPYLPLDAVPGLSYRVDEAAQQLVLDGRPEAFSVSVLAPRRADLQAPEPASAGGFVNYDLQASAARGRHGLDALLEVGLFNRLGFGTATFLGQSGGTAPRRLRLDTRWTRDEPQALRSLTIGDSISHAGSWGRSLRFGGVQWATNFAVRPDFVPFALPTVSGAAALPSTVELYVDNALRLSRSVPSGPFEIPDAPVLGGDGQARLVVRDLLGRETVVTQPYYVSPSLLRPGLREEAYELGFVRRRYGRASSDYGPPFGAATLRIGLDDRLTAELRGELQARQQTLGASAAFLVASRALASASLAVSHHAQGAGGLLALGIEHQGRPLGFAFETRLASPRFAQLGGGPEADLPRRSHLARASLATGRGGSAFASVVARAGRAGGDLKLLTLGYNLGLGDQLYLSLFGLRMLGGERAHSIGMHLTWALGSRTTASASHSRGTGGGTSTAQLQQSLPPGSGIGYRLAASDGSHSRQQAALVAQNAIGMASLEVERLDRASSLRAGVAGGVALLDGRAYLARRIDESFAVVKVGDYGGIEVFLDNQAVARTDGAGYALLPRLRPYQGNVVTVRPEQLPLDAELTDLRLELTPARRSAVGAAFAVRPARGALLRIVLDDGAPLPPGALVGVAGSSHEFPVARRGEAYVTGLAQRNVVQARWKGRQCEIEVELPAQAGPLPVLGPLACHGVRP